MLLLRMIVALTEVAPLASVRTNMMGWHALIMAFGSAKMDIAPSFHPGPMLGSRRA